MLVPKNLRDILQLCSRCRSLALCAASDVTGNDKLSHPARYAASMSTCLTCTYSCLLIRESAASEPALGLGCGFVRQLGYSEVRPMFDGSHLYFTKGMVCMSHILVQSLAPRPSVKFQRSRTSLGARGVQSTNVCDALMVPQDVTCSRPTASLIPAPTKTGIALPERKDSPVVRGEQCPRSVLISCRFGSGGVVFSVHGSPHAHIKMRSVDKNRQICFCARKDFSCHYRCRNAV